MKMKTLLTLLLCTTVYIVNAQKPPEGTWYNYAMAVMNIKYVQLEMTPDSMVTRTIYSTDMPPRVEVKKIKYTRYAHNQYYFLTGTDTSLGLIITSPSVKDSVFYFAIVVEDEALFHDTASAFAYIKSDTLNRLMLISFSEKQYKKINNFPSFDLIKKQDLKTYLAGCLDKLNGVMARVKDKSKPSPGNFMIVMVVYSDIITTEAIKLGYNPGKLSAQLNTVFKKYESDEELKPLIAAFKKGPKGFMEKN